MGILFSLLGSAQTDSITEPYIPKDFSNYNSILQLSLGGNIPVGNYKIAKEPYASTYASGSIKHRVFNLNVKYSKLYTKGLGWEVGVEFIRNTFDGKRFEDNYLKITGDTVHTRLGVFLYEHLSLYGGTNYSFACKRFMLTANAGVGVLYNFPIPKKGSATVPLPPSSVSSYGEGNYKIVRGVAPMLYSGLNLKYYLGSEYYIVFNGQFTYSAIKINIEEKFTRDRTEVFLEKFVPVNNIGLTIGLGTIIN